MGKTLAELKAGLDLAKSKVLYYDTNESYSEAHQDAREIWVEKVKEYERLIDESARILEG